MATLVEKSEPIKVTVYGDGEKSTEDKTVNKIKEATDEAAEFVGNSRDKSAMETDSTNAEANEGTDEPQEPRLTEPQLYNLLLSYIV